LLHSNSRSFLQRREWKKEKKLRSFSTRIKWVLPIVLSTVPLFKRESWSCDRSHDENEYRINYQFCSESQYERSLKNINSQNSIKMIVLFFVLPLILFNSGKRAERKIKRERKSIRISMRQICYMSTSWFS